MSGSWDNTVKVWQYKGSDGIYNKPVLSYSIDSEVRSIASCQSQPNILNVSSENGTIYMFDTRATTKCIKEWHKAHKDEVNSMTFIPNKFEFVSCSSDCYMKHWNASNGKLIKQIAARENLNCIQTDGQLLISGGESGIIRMFQVDELKETDPHSLRLSTSHSISKIHVSKLSRYVVVGTKEYTKNVHIFEARGGFNEYKRKPRHLKSKSLPFNQGPNNDELIVNEETKHSTKTKTYSFGSNAFAKLTKSATSLFSFASNAHK